MAQLATIAATLNVQAPKTALAGLATSSGSIVYYLKPYYGSLEGFNGPSANVRFYDEREWRYVPTEVETIPAVTREMLYDSDMRREADAKVPALHSLPFEPDDIRYIVVAKDSEVTQAISDVRSVKDKYDPTTVDRLISRIVSAERIRDDF